MYVGNFKGNSCEISSASPNRSVCITGLSGTGKTSRMNQIELAGVNNGNTVIILDINKTHVLEQVFPPIRSEYMKEVNCINVLKDGMECNLFTVMRTKEGEEESFVNLVSSAVSYLNLYSKMGTRQTSVLRGAVIFAIEHFGRYHSEAEALQAGFQLEEDKSTARDVQEKLWTLLNCGALQQTKKKLETGKINILDFSGIDMHTRIILAEIFLDSLWRRVCFGESNIAEHPLIVALDEFQNLSFEEGLTLKKMLCEGRKFGLQLLLATQTFGIFQRKTKNILNQAATHLYFRPVESEVQEIVKYIRPKDVEKMKTDLLALKMGESIAVGDLCIKGRQFRRPILLK